MAARTNRDYLRGLYGVIKSCDAHVRFTFLTGISKFSKVNLFSQLNNLTDITLDRRYSAICGYTDRDLDTVFAPELAGLDRERVREWYNGYGWRGAEKVYNPYDALLLFDSREFKGSLVRDRDAGVSGGDDVRPRGLLGITGSDGQHGGLAVGVRRRPHRHGGVAVSDRLPDDHGGRGAGWSDSVPAGLSEPGSEAEPQRPPPATPGAGRSTADGEQHAPGAAACGARLRGIAGAVPCVLREHSVRVVHQQ